MILLTLFACGNDVVITPGQEGCEDFNYSDPAESKLEWDVPENGVVKVWRTAGLLDQTGLEFDPTIDTENKVIHVREAWTGGDSDEQFCYQPTVTLEGLTGKLQVRWYLALDDSSPFETIDIEP